MHLETVQKLFLMVKINVLFNLIATDVTAVYNLSNHSRGVPGLQQGSPGNLMRTSARGKKKKKKGMLEGLLS